MRLTLRTLLAYMDDILEPSDHEDLGNKIEASDFATELIHRSRDTVRRLRLGAPAVFSEGGDDVLDAVDLSDANSVAEYLDNTLPPEQVADFERLCLEPGTKPDMHLAEVASCHHVLTMVLGEPAEVDQDLKARMYQLPEQLGSGQKLRIEPSHTEAAPAETQPTAPPVQEAPPAAPAPTPAASPQPELPDYLREAAAAKRHSRRLAIATTLIAAAGVVFYWFANAPEPQVPDVVAQSGMESFDGEIEIEGLNEAPSISTGQTDSTSTGESLSSAPPFVPQVVSPTDPAAASSSTAGDLEEAPPFAAAQPEVEPEAVVVVPVPEGETDAPEAIEVELIEQDEASVETSVAAATPAEIPLTPDSEKEREELEKLVGGPIMVEEESQAIETAETASEPEIVEPTGPQRLGNYLGNNDVLLIFNKAQRKWLRLPPRSPISTGDELLTLPKFFTHVVLADVNAYLLGGTRLRIPVEKFESLTNQAELNLEMVNGRMLLNAGLNGSQVTMKVGDQLREFRLSGSASLAVDVEHVFVPGSDYENEAAPVRATWYLTSGAVEWPTAAGGQQSIEPQSMWRTIDGIDEIPELIDELPAWIDREPMTDMERRARDDVARELKSGEPVEIRLLELTDGKGLGRRKEVRVLAAASSVYVGEFEPLVKALNNSDQSHAWATHIQDLRQAMVLSPDVATQVRQAFENIRGDAAARDLMEMVMGYNDDQIGRTREAFQSGALSQLLRWLDHESLDYRVLAIHNIREITGKWKGYRPDDLLKRRKIQMRKLWDAFESNELWDAFESNVVTSRS